MGGEMPRSDPSHQQAAHDLETQLVGRSGDPNRPRPLCAVIDIPVISLFTFRACAAAMEWGLWKVLAGDIEPGEIRFIPGLPEEMALVYSDLKRRSTGPPRGGSHGPIPNWSTGIGGPPSPGDCPPWVPGIEGSIALMFNTCDDLERPLIEYMNNRMAMPAWGVGLLLAEQFWKPSGSLILDRRIREHGPTTNN